MARSRRKTFLYLLHFRTLHRGKKHYLGCTSCPDLRIAQHLVGDGAEITRGAIFDLARLWTGTWQDEQRLKKEGHLDRHCPICIRESTSDLSRRSKAEAAGLVPPKAG